MKGKESIARLAKTILLACLLLSFVCSNQPSGKTFEGDLTFKLVDLGSFYSLQDGLENEFTSYIDSLKALPMETLSTNEKDFLSHVSLLEKNGLMQLPFFKLLIDSSVHTVYCQPEGFKKVADFERAVLLAENSKVRIRLNGTRILDDQAQSTSIILCEEILSVNKVPGKTEWRS